MNLSSEELLFVEKRAELIRYWPLFGVGILFLHVALVVWLWIKVPFLVNPWAVSAGLESGVLAESTMLLMVAMLPIVMFTLVAFVAVAVVLTFAAMSNERRLIRLIERSGVISGKNL